MVSKGGRFLHSSARNTGGDGGGAAARERFCTALDTFLAMSILIPKIQMLKKINLSQKSG